MQKLFDKYVFQTTELNLLLHLNSIRHFHVPSYFRLLETIC